MARRSRSRKQRVVLRAKHRDERHRQITSSLIALAVISVIVVGGRAMAVNAWAPGFIQRHTPVIELKAPETLADLPLLKQTPSGHFWFWFPGADWPLKRQWMRDYPALSGVEFEKHFMDNRIVARLEPRVPLVRFDDRGLDKEGRVFTLASQSWSALPKAFVPAPKSLPILGHWLAELSRSTDFWSQVVAVSQDPRGEMWLDLRTGTRVAWGPPEVKTAHEKVRCLAMVLDDAHKRLSGAASADVRFFEEGRVIVRPKSNT